MKTTFKIMLTLMIGVFMFGLQSCSDKDEPEAKIAVTKSEIQGTWHTSAYGQYHLFSFEGNNYVYNRMNIKTSNIEVRESGTYSLNGLTITFRPNTGTSKLGECDIYWENNMKSLLHIYPMGTYSKAK